MNEALSVLLVPGLFAGVAIIAFVFAWWSD